MKVNFGRLIAIINFKVRDPDGWLIKPTILFRKPIGSAKITAIAVPLFQLVILTQNKS